MRGAMKEQSPKLDIVSENFLLSYALPLRAGVPNRMLRFLAETSKKVIDVWFSCG